MVIDLAYNLDCGFFLIIIRVKMKMMSIEDDHNVTEAGVTRAFSAGGRTSTSGAVALSRTLVSSWSGYCHH